VRFKAKEKVALGKNYWRLFSAHAISNLGDGIAAIAYPWLASAVTRSPFLIALVAVASRLPWLIFTLSLSQWILLGAAWHFWSQ